MSRVKRDFDDLEKSLMNFFNSIKKPATWNAVVSSTGVTLDRTAVAILYMLDEDLGGNKTCHVQDLAKKLNIEAPSVTRKTQELEALGYLKRSEDPSDKRATLLSVTSKGRSVSQKIWESRSKMLKSALDDWTKDDRTKFTELLQKFADDFVKITHSRKEK